MGMIRYNDKNYTAGEAERKANSYVLEALEKHKGDFENPHKVTAEQAGAYTKAEADKKLSAHTERTDNPHKVTAEQVGAYTKTEADKKLSAHTNRTDNPHEVTKGQVGLSNADNTSDMDKPVSTAQAAAFAKKADITYVDGGLAEKQDNALVIDVTLINDEMKVEMSATYQEIKAALASNRDVIVNVGGYRCVPVSIDHQHMYIRQSDGILLVINYMGLTYYLVKEPSLDYLNRLFAEKADKATTLSGYGITDAYTKTEVDKQFEDMEGVINEQNESKLTLVSGTEKDIDTYYGIQDEDGIWHPQMYKITSEDTFGMTNYYYLYAVPTNSAAIMMPPPPPYTYQYKICAGGIYMRKGKNSLGWSEWDKYAADSDVDAKTISGSIVTINNTEESTPLSVNLTSDTVTDFSNVTVYETGKNLFDINSWVEESSTKYLSLVRKTENGIVINNSRTVDSAICWYMFLPAGTYTFSLNKLRTNSIFVSDTIDGEYTLKANVKPADGELTKTIIFSEPKYIKYVTYCNPGVETTLEYFQIELGEVATEFEPYKGTSFTPEASGKVSNMVSLSPTTIIYTNSIDTVVNVSYEAKESTIEIVDNLESTDDKKALSANQGRILNEKIDECKQSITKISKVSGAKMAIIGDSISHGVGSMILSNGTAVPTSGTNMLTYKNQAWWQLVRDRYGIDNNVLNNSQTGASFTIDGSSKDDEGNIINRRFTTYLNTDDLPEDLDIIMVFGGTNDWSQSKALGTIDDEPSTENNATFYAAVKSVLDYLTINFPDAQLVFVTPLQRYRDNTFNAKNTQNLYMKDYVDAIKTLCAVYGVQVVDLYSNSKFHMNSEEFRNTYVPDGTHPNAEGTERYVKNGIFPTLDKLWLGYTN